MAALRVAVPLLACSVLLSQSAPPASAGSGRGTPASAPAATRDLPIATASGEAPVLLDGADWQATGAGSAWTTGESSHGR